MLRGIVLIACMCGQPVVVFPECMCSGRIKVNHVALHRMALLAEKQEDIVCLSGSTGAHLTPTKVADMQIQLRSHELTVTHNVY